MNNPDNELKFEVSEKLFESGCMLNSKRIKILGKAFIKLCNQSEHLKKLFEKEIEALQIIDKKEEELHTNLDPLL